MLPVHKLHVVEQGIRELMELGEKTQLHQVFLKDLPWVRHMFKGWRGGKTKRNHVKVLTSS